MLKKLAGVLRDAVNNDKLEPLPRDIRDWTGDRLARYLDGLDKFRPSHMARALEMRALIKEAVRTSPDGVRMGSFSGVSRNYELASPLTRDLILDYWTLSNFIEN